MVPHTILFIAANPVGTDRRALEEQARAIQVELERAGRRDCFQFETRWAAQPLDLLREMVKYKPTVVHFCGGRIIDGANGARPGGVYFQAADGCAQLVPAKALANAFDAAGSVKLVVLDACYSEEHAAAVAMYIDCVIGIAGETVDGAAVSFAIGLYGGLGEGESVAAAFKQGCAAIGLTGAGDPGQPQLRVRTGVDASGLVLTERRETSGRGRVDADVEEGEPLSAGAARQRGIDAAGNVTAHDVAGRDVHVSMATAPHAPVLAAGTQSPTLGTHTFVGRERELAEIERLLTGADVQLHAALDGLPGIGKTELARQVVARLVRGKQFPGGIFWFNAEHTDLRMQWAELVDDSSNALPDLDTRARWAVRQVEQRAQQGDAVLIVLDNVETWEPRPRPLPNMAAIRLLVTTRARWLHNSLRPYEVPPLDPEPARDLLRTIIGHEVVGADELLAALGGHVLSIELAATYLREFGTSPVTYLQQLATGKDLSSSVADQTSYRATAQSAFRLLWNGVALDVRHAWVLAAQLPPSWFSSELAEAIGLDAERRRALVRLHLLDRDSQGRHQMHRLLREFALAEQPPSTSVQRTVILGATELLDTGDDALTFQRYRRDADSFAHLAASANPFADARFRTRCGWALKQLGELVAARQLLEQALASDLQTYGQDHSEVATDRNNLALVLQDLGELAAARQLLEQALASDLRSYSEDDPRVAIRRNNLAMVLRDLGELPIARELLEQALVSDLRTYGEDHPEVARSRSNLALVLQALGELVAARKLFEQALASGVKTYGEDHPAVVRCRSNLASVLQDLGELVAARKLYKQALVSGLRTYGEDHPEVARCRNNLALVLQDLGELAAARPLLEQALASGLKTYGEDHPAVARCRINLAGMHRALGDLAAARLLSEQALASGLKTYGEDHPEVAICRSSLALVLQALGELAAARLLLEQALASFRKTYGENHPRVTKVRSHLAGVLRDLGELPAGPDET